MQNFAINPLTIGICWKSFLKAHWRTVLSQIPLVMAVHLSKRTDRSMVPQRSYGGAMSHYKKKHIWPHPKKSPKERILSPIPFGYTIYYSHQIRDTKSQRPQLKDACRGKTLTATRTLVTENTPLATGLSPKEDLLASSESDPIRPRIPDYIYILYYFIPLHYPAQTPAKITPDFGNPKSKHRPRKSKLLSAWEPKAWA